MCSYWISSCMCVRLSVTAPVWILYSGITDSSLRLGIYDPNQYFHHILSSEQVSNKSATFVYIYIYI